MKQLFIVLAFFSLSAFTLNGEAKGFSMEVGGFYNLDSEGSYRYFIDYDRLYDSSLGKTIKNYTSQSGVDVGFSIPVGDRISFDLGGFYQGSTQKDKVFDDFDSSYFFPFHNLELENEEYVEDLKERVYGFRLGGSVGVYDFSRISLSLESHVYVYKSTLELMMGEEDVLFDNPLDSYAVDVRSVDMSFGVGAELEVSSNFSLALKMPWVANVFLEETMFSWTEFTRKREWLSDVNRRTGYTFRPSLHAKYYF